jgi:hypothetical protein
VSDSNYTLIDTHQEDSLLSNVLTLGAVIRRAVDLETGELLIESAIEPRRVPFQGGADDGTREAAPLSKMHKSPFVEWAAGGGLLKVHNGKENTAPKGGKRGKVTTFSYASRRRLMYTIARIRLDAPLPMFVTLTYPEKFPSPMESKKHLDIFNKRLVRAFPDAGFIWKLEPQQRGAPHYHLLVWGVSEHDLFMFTVSAWYEIAGDGDNRHLAFHMGGLGNQPCVSAVRSRKGVMQYAAKYLGKTFDVAGWDEIYPGRFWAVVQRDNIPFGLGMIMYITKKDAHTWMRYQRRFSGIKSRNYSSLTTFCRADDWTSNIMEVQKENQS